MDTMKKLKFSITGEVSYSNGKSEIDDVEVRICSDERDTLTIGAADFVERTNLGHEIAKLFIEGANGSIE